MDPAYESAQQHLETEFVKAARQRETQVREWAFELYRDTRRTWFASDLDFDEWDKYRADVIQACEDDARAFAKVWA